MLKALLLTCVLSTCARAQTQDSRTIFKYLQDEGFGQLVELLRAAGMEADLSNPDSNPVTIFAPDDAAFSTISQSLQIKLLTNTTFLRQVLNGHMADEQILRFFIRDQQQKQDMNGNTLTFNIYPNGVTTVNGAVITGGDVILLNGLVHPINKVLLPVEESISMYLAEHESDFKDLFGFVVLARLFGVLSGPGPFTVFAPSDAAFARVQNQILPLVQNPNRTELTELLKNHVVAGEYWAAGLSDGMSLTSLHGSQIDVTHLGALVTLNGRAHVIKPDDGATNGVIHTIDTVLFLP